MTGIYDNADFQNVVLTVLALVVLAVGLGCLYTFIRAIFMFIFSQAKEENKKKGRNSIRFMIIGVILTIVLLFLVPTVLRWMNVPKYSLYTPRNIFNRAGELINGLFNLGNVIKQSQTNSEYRGDFYYNTNGTSTQPISSDPYSL